MGNVFLGRCQRCLDNAYSESECVNEKDRDCLIGRHRAAPPEPTPSLTPNERERVVAVLQRAKPFMAAAAAGSALVGDWEASGANALGELVSLLADLTKEGK